MKRWLGLSVLLVGLWQPVAWAEMKERVLQVTGQGMVTLPTQLAEVEVGVEIRGNSANQVQTEIAQRMNRLVRTLQQRQAEKINTTALSLSPLYGERQQLLGFLGRSAVEFRLPISQAGAVVDELIAQGANQIARLQFIASDTALEQGRTQALQLAAQDAQRQAQTVLAALQLAPKEVINVQILSTTLPVPEPVAFAQQRLSTPILGGEQVVRAQVRLEIRY
ncbi:MAG: SIMPL domain-containing protein [Gloeomargarita sp. SKYG116]|nr:SIMPL domain-containing protein [Gloeomargarita sp. SKYG116]MCS7293007.1 SIMPL domain-containing protein [Gloeomargarita sp. SKYB120]MDW8178572.1 SIMPL domain-containing protein [Gloeomargarita sp. SKYBB_i_bin120]MDW8400198.1 SIMPL domain-containing protein [Gloeomargarita sp. SKYGB_i_bin116]